MRPSTRASSSSMYSYREDFAPEEEELPPVHAAPRVKLLPHVRKATLHGADEPTMEEWLSRIEREPDFTVGSNL